MSSASCCLEGNTSCTCRTNAGTFLVASHPEDPEVQAALWLVDLWAEDYRRRAPRVETLVTRRLAPFQGKDL